MATLVTPATLGPKGPPDCGVVADEGVLLEAGLDDRPLFTLDDLKKTELRKKN